MTAVSPTGAATGADLYFQVQQFYAAQMQLLDEGRTDEWAGTFTEDGVFAANAHPEPAAGRAVIAEAAGKAAAAYAERGVQRRHWLGMVSVDPAPDQDGAVRASCYALVLETPRGERTAIACSTTCVDLLVRGEDGGWQVRDRRVTRDDLR